MDFAGSTLLIAGALGAGGAGIVSLRYSWRRRSAAGRLALTLGWSALLLCLFAFSAAFGSEFGISYALAWIALCAFLVVASNREVRPPASDSPGLTGHGSGRLYKWLVFIAAGPLAGIATAQLTLLVCMLLPATRTTQVAIAVVLFPLLWACAAFWITAARLPGRASLGCVACALVATGALHLMR
ncbi:MAG: hypothetical protein AAGA91_14215 [Pseudomonadota bacterium]